MDQQTTKTNSCSNWAGSIGPHYNTARGVQSAPVAHCHCDSSNKDLNSNSYSNNQFNYATYYYAPSSAQLHRIGTKPNSRTRKDWTTSPPSVSYSNPPSCLSNHCMYNPSRDHQVIPDKSGNFTPAVTDPSTYQSNQTIGTHSLSEDNKTPNSFTRIAERASVDTENSYLTSCDTDSDFESLNLTIGDELFEDSKLVDPVLPDCDSSKFTQLDYRLQLCGLFAPIAEQDSESETSFSSSSPLTDRAIIECLIGTNLRVQMEDKSNRVRLSRPSTNYDVLQSSHSNAEHKQRTLDSSIKSKSATFPPTRSVGRQPSIDVFPIVELQDMESLTASVSSRLSAHSDGEGSEDSGFAGSIDQTPVEQQTPLEQNADTLEGPNGDIRRRSTSMVEAKEQTNLKLREELSRAQVELELKESECGKLERVRDQMEQELEELTASLFEEANKMVQDANIKRMRTEKLLTESRSQNDMLLAEVEALKTMVLTSTPAEPNRHLHPQIQEPKMSLGPSLSAGVSNGSTRSKEAPESPGTSITKKLSFKKTHKRSTSHHIVKKEAQVDFVFDPTKPAPEPPSRNHQDQTDSFNSQEDPEAYSIFLEWRSGPTCCPSNRFIERILRDDVKPCLSFPNHKLSEQLLECVQNNSVCMEPIPGAKRTMKMCPLLEHNSLCSYRLKLNDDEWFEISEIVRNRIATVCELFTYIGYVKNGLIKNCSPKDMFWHITDLRRALALARLGFSSVS